MNRSELEALSRGELIERALRLGIPRPEVMTRVELADEIVRRLEPDPAARKRARGWLGVARDLVAGLIEQGFNMPDAAKLVRSGAFAPTRIIHQPPVATVTLAEIYARQGHGKRALAMLDEVLKKEPDHAAARALFERLSESARPAEPEPVPEPESEREPEREPESEREPATLSQPEREPATLSQPEREPATLSQPELEPATLSQPEPEREPATLSQPELEPATLSQPEPEPATLSQPEPERVPEPEPLSRPELEVVAPPPLLTEPMPALHRTFTTEPAPLPEALPDMHLIDMTPAKGAPVVPPAPEPETGAAEHDELWVVRDAEGAVRLHWTLSAASVAAQRERAPHGRALIRVVRVTPSFFGPEVRESEHEAPGSKGSAVLDATDETVHVRAALGWQSSEGFLPLAVGVEVELHDGGEPSVRWEPLARRVGGSGDTKQRFAVAIASAR
jgi:hypothetical protein